MSHLRRTQDANNRQKEEMSGKWNSQQLAESVHQELAAGWPATKLSKVSPLIVALLAACTQKFRSVVWCLGHINAFSGPRLPIFPLALRTNCGHPSYTPTWVTTRATFGACETSKNRHGLRVIDSHGHMELQYCRTNRDTSTKSVNRRVSRMRGVDLGFHFTTCIL